MVTGFSQEGNNMRDQKVATVIGVGPGLGAALARCFASNRAVAMVARNAEKLNELGRNLRSRRNFPVVPADVSKEQENVGTFERIRSELGDTDLLLYNAAMHPQAR
jgi:NADP-dependent 3-hydroxy acid dehydrogenase YdfG